MRAEIIKRVKMLESIVRDSGKPYMVFIELEEDGRYHIMEDYQDKTKRKPTRKVKYVDRLEDYIIPPEWNPTILLNTFYLGDQSGDLYQFYPEEIRTNCHIGEKDSFSLKVTDQDPDDFSTDFEIIIYEV